MKSNIKELYTLEHSKKTGIHLYPTEWVIRTMLGNYPALYFDKSKYINGRVLDVGFGDGRNFSLLNNIGLEIYGIEITDDIVNLARDNFKGLVNELNLKVGSNLHIPFGDKFFDIILASSSLYYIEDGTSFNDNLAEYCRAMKSGGVLIANLPELSKNFICQGSDNLGDNHIVIKNDIHKLRNGCVLRAFNSKDEVIQVFSPYFKDICVGYLYEEYFGYELSSFVIVATKI